MRNRLPGKTATNLQSLNEDALRDESERGHFLHDTVECRLVKGDGVLGLVLDFALGPLLLFCGFAATG